MLMTTKIIGGSGKMLALAREFQKRFPHLYVFFVACLNNTR
jgi:hypothetical protein